MSKDGILVEHTVRAGDSTDSIAFAHGHFPEYVWNHPANAKLRERRESRNVLLPGDVLRIPERRSKELRLPTGATHRFRRRGVPSKLRLQLVGQAHAPYTLTIAGEPARHHTTDGEGVLEEWIRPDATRAELVYGLARHRAVLELGHLDPLTSDRGRQQRLNNLGFDCGRSDGTVDEPTRAALRRFQKRMRLYETGRFDDPTLRALADVHDGDGTLPDPGAAR